MSLGKKTRKALSGEYTPVKTYGELTPGKAIRLYREIQGLSQNELSELSGLKQATISALENDKITLGISRAKVLAKALKVHPGVLAFPDWDDSESVA